MIVEAIYHKPDSNYCFATGNKSVVLRLRTSKKDAFDKISVIYGGKYTYKDEQNTAEMKVSFCDALFNYYTVKLDIADVRFVYVFEIRYRNKIYYFSEDGISDTYDFSLAYYNSFQLPYINSADVQEVVPWMRSAVFYEIFIDRFKRGDFKKNDAYVNMKWGEIPTPSSFAGGDIKGISEKLPYLQKLGVNALYLTPIFKAASNHKYDISDYYEIDETFGTKSDFKLLVDEAHARGMKIVLDAVFNHCSENLPQFMDVMEKGKKSRYHSWFIIDGDKPDKNKMNFECFASCYYMPKFNTSEPEVKEYLINIAEYWTKKFKIDGWRLDVSDEVSHDFWRHFRERVKAINNDCVIIGENWHDAFPYLYGGQYDGIMNYAFTKACLDFFASAVISPEEFAFRLNALYVRNTDNVNNMMLNLLDSHDTHRFLTRAQGNTDKLLCALACCYVYTGAPCVYYGTEIGMEGGYDPDCRRTMDWDKADKPSRVFEIIRALNALKSKNDTLKNGNLRVYEKNGLVSIERFNDNICVALTLNGAGGAVKIDTEGEMLLSQNFGDGVLGANGFLITQIKN